MSFYLLRGFGLEYWRRPVISLYIVLYKGTLLLKTLTFCKEFESAGEFINFHRNKDIHIFTSPILIIPIILILISSLLIFSIQKQSIYNDSFKHIVSGFLGYFIAIAISYIPLDKFKRLIIPFYFLSLLSLVLIYFIGISNYGAQRWLGLGFVTFQPLKLQN